MVTVSTNGINAICFIWRSHIRHMNVTDGIQASRSMATAFSHSSTRTSDHFDIVCKKISFSFSHYQSLFLYLQLLNFWRRLCSFVASLLYIFSLHVTCYIFVMHQMFGLLKAWIIKNCICSNTSCTSSKSDHWKWGNNSNNLDIDVRCCRGRAIKSSFAICRNSKIFQGWVRWLGMFTTKILYWEKW